MPDRLRNARADEVLRGTSGPPVVGGKISAMRWRVAVSRSVGRGEPLASEWSQRFAHVTTKLP